LNKLYAIILQLYTSSIISNTGTIYYFYYFAVPASEPSSVESSHTNPGPASVQSGLTGHSNAKNMLASGSAGRHAEWQLGNMFCRSSFFTIIRISNLTIILIILNICAGFGR
jgi:hypothetical protein